MQPHRAESFKFPTDPLFVKVRDIVALYLDPVLSAERVGDAGAA